MLVIYAENSEIFKHFQVGVIFRRDLFIEAESFLNMGFIKFFVLFFLENGVDFGGEASKFVYFIVGSLVDF